MITWIGTQRSRVASVLRVHPIGLGKCLQAAQQVLPIATERDSAASGFRIKPRLGRYLPTPPTLTQRYWRNHFTVGLLKCYVDALAGADGELELAYISKHFVSPEEVRVTIDSLTLDDPQ